MSKAVQVPNSEWQKKILVGVKEDGSKEYETITGRSKEEVDELAKKMARKRKLGQQNEWQKENMERMSVVFNKGTKERIASVGGSINGFIREAVENELRRRGK